MKKKRRNSNGKERRPHCRKFDKFYFFIFLGILLWVKIHYRDIVRYSYLLTEATPKVLRSVHLQDAAHPDPGLYVASALVPKVDSTEWGDVKAPEYNRLPPRLAYGIAGRAGSFKDPILYSSSYRYTVDIDNHTISVPGGGTIRRRDMPKIPAAGIRTKMLPQARVNQFRQYHDVVEILKHFAEYECFGNPMFLIIEDDFQICPDALVNEFPKINKWAHENWRFWSLIRVGFGLSGILVKCQDMEQLVRYLETRLIEWHLKKIANGQFAIDWHVSTFYHTQIEKKRRVYVYHSNLLQHTTSRSIVWVGTNEYNMKWRSKHQRKLFRTCGDGALSGKHSGLYIDDVFDDKICLEHAFSPCQTVRYHKIGRSGGKSIVLVPGIFGKSCSSSCPVVLKDELSTCDGTSFKAINKCSLVDKAFFADDSVHDCTYEHGTAYPLVNGAGEIILSKENVNTKAVDSLCHSSPKNRDSKRFCPCTFGQTKSIFKYRATKRLDRISLLAMCMVVIVYVGYVVLGTSKKKRREKNVQHT